MKNRFTPGPWEVDASECLKVRNTSGSIAMIMQTHLRGRRNNDETHANARLIAAAPDMLEALRDALDNWEIHNRSGDGMQGDWVHDARTAIAKATGQ